VVTTRPLYEDDNIESLRIQFKLGSLSFVLDCGYDWDEATMRLNILRDEPIGDHEAPELFDSFINEVRQLCIAEEVRVSKG
jgi:hypothetical protein